MAVLNREDYFKAVNERVGNDTSDEALAFLENMTDTYSALEKAGQNDEQEDWHQKYIENDEAWRVKYQRRFNGGGALDTFGSEGASGNEPQEKEITPETITIDDLFRDD